MLCGTAAYVDFQTRLPTPLAAVLQANVCPMGGAKTYSGPPAAIRISWTISCSGRIAAWYDPQAQRMGILLSGVAVRINSSQRAPG